MAFTHLQIRSGYSFFNSTITINKLIQEAKSLSYKALALTDEGVLHGAIGFYKTCMENGIKPILGMTIEVTTEAREETFSIVILAKTNQGYQNLMSLSTEIQLHGVCDSNLLQKYTADLICILSVESTPFLKESLLQQQYDRLEADVSSLRKLFHGPDFYMAVEMYQANEATLLIDRSKEYQLNSETQMVAHTDVRYLKKTDLPSYHCLQVMKQGKKWDGSQPNLSMQHHHLRSPEEMEEIFADWPAPLRSSEEIVAKCSVHFDFEQQLLPAFPVPTGETAAQYLENACKQAIPSKYTNVTDDVDQRLRYELRVIEQLGFSDYFLIVADFVQYAKENGIVVGPGRGSAAGSLVAYLLGITNVDPLQYDLLFERFLNPERVTMPDIDIDFSDVRRDEVIEYVRHKYGADHVAQIITFGTFAARSLVRELMKTMEIDHRDQAYILKHIPVQASDPIATYINASTEFSTYIKQSEQLKLLFTIAVKLEGLPRHTSTHAAGIVIGKKPLHEDVPLTKGSHDTYLTQYAMHELEAIGLLKIDVLGLRNLTLMERIVQSINRMENKAINVDMLPESDESTFQLLQAGKTNGIFQLESAGMKNVLTQLKPNYLEDIIALNALYRPGPMEQIPTYMKRKHGQEKVTYLHPNLKPILESTYGVLIYQEQIMQVAHQFAGLTLGQADILRRAISKKNSALIHEQKDAFIQGCLKQGYALQVAEEVFSWIYKFANYGFNKSHSVAYSKIAYQLSYLKAHYPTYFFAHLLGTAMNDSAKLHMYVREANELGIEVLPPSINKSYAYFTVEKTNIRIGLMAIKGIGFETVKEIIDRRKERNYRDVFDFCLRTSHVKRNALEMLILAGTFDETHGNRASLLASIDQAIARAELFGDVNGQGDLFPNEMKMRPAYTEIDDFSQMQKLADEKELLQMYVTNHPLKQYRRQLTMQKFSTIQHIGRLAEQSKVTIIAIVQEVKKIHTKRGDSMAFITITDETGEIDGVVFPALYREVSPLLKDDMTSYLEGKVSIRQGKKQLIIDSLKECDLEEMMEKSPGYLYIKMTKEKQQDEVLASILGIAEKHPGESAIIIHREVDKQTYKLEMKYNMHYDEQSASQLKEYFGSENVVFRR